jgi:hypothetical protein
MTLPLHIEPTQMDLAAIAGRRPDGPFVALEHHPGHREAFERHRRTAIEQATLLFFAARAEPRLGTPYDG